MITTLDIIDRLPCELQARLEADDYFVDVPVIVEEHGNLEAEMNRQMAVITAKGGKRGVAVIVLQVIGDDDFPNLQFGPMTLRPAFQVLENVELNGSASGTGKSARKVARRIRDVIKCAGMVGLVKNMQADKPCIEPVPMPKEMSGRAQSYQVNFRCLEVSTEEMHQVATPQITGAAGSTFTITCATSGASIYYTTDDSYPRAGGATSVLYTAPVAVPVEGVTVRACAYKSGWVASWVNRVAME